MKLKMSNFLDQLEKKLIEFLINECAVSDNHSNVVAKYCVKIINNNSESDRAKKKFNTIYSREVETLLNAYTKIKGIVFEKDYCPNIQELRTMVYEIYDNVIIDN
jgi:hypothetical protein